MEVSHRESGVRGHPNRQVHLRCRRLRLIEPAQRLHTHWFAPLPAFRVRVLRRSIVKSKAAPFEAPSLHLLIRIRILRASAKKSSHSRKTSVSGVGG